MPPTPPALPDPAPLPPQAPPCLPAPAPALAPRQAWAMLLALCAGFALSQAFRTVTAILAGGLQAEFGLSAPALGVFAGAFAFAFGAMQVFMGVGIDVYGLRRTVLCAFPLAVAGAMLSALAPGYGTLLAGQVLIGVGCAPAFLVCTVFIARHFPARRFAFVSGMALGLGGLGMLFTGTPLAWLVQQSSWRMGFVALAGLSALAWGLIFWRVHEPRPPAGHAAREPLGVALRGFGALFLLPHTWGIVLLALVTYASFLALRGLWLGPLLTERHGFSLVHSGHVAIGVSLASLLSPGVFGRLDPGPARRRRWLLACTVGMAGLFLALAFWPQASANVACALAVGLLSGYMVLQYADVRSAYPAALTGRAMAVFTMAMFLGVALVQAATGAVAALAQAQGVEPQRAVMASIAALLVLGALAFRGLPAPPPP